MLSCVAIRVAFRAIRYELQGAAPVAVRVRISVMLRCVRCHSGCGRAQGPPLHVHTTFRDVVCVVPFGLHFVMFRAMPAHTAFRDVSCVARYRNSLIRFTMWSTSES